VPAGDEGIDQLFDFSKSIQRANGGQVVVCGKRIRRYCRDDGLIQDAVHVTACPVGAVRNESKRCTGAVCFLL
jgi:hypothetical protein